MRTGNLLLMSFLTMMGCSDEVLQEVVAQDDVIYAPTREAPMEAVADDPVHAQESPEDPQWERVPRAPMRLDEQPEMEDENEDIGDVEEDAPIEESPPEVEDVEEEVPEVAEEVPVEDVLEDPPVDEEIAIEEVEMESETPVEDTSHEEPVMDEPEDDPASSAAPSCSDGIDYYIRITPDGSLTIVYCEDDVEPAPVMENPPVEDPPADDPPMEDPIDEPEVDVPEEVEPPQILLDMDVDGFMENEDCNDLDAAVRPDATETCGDGMDNNCNGFVDNEAEVDGCHVEEEPIVVEEIPPVPEDVPEVPPEDPPVESVPETQTQEPEPVVSISSENGTAETQTVMAGDGMALGQFVLVCTARSCTVKSLTLRVSVEDADVDVRDVFWRCRLNQVAPVEVGGIGGPRSLDYAGTYVANMDLSMESGNTATFIPVCEITSSAPSAARISTILVLAQTVILDENNLPLPLVCEEDEGDPVIGVLVYSQ